MTDSLKRQERGKGLFRKLYAPLYQGQTYRNLIYLALSFPLGMLYFSTLIPGFSTGISLSFMLIGLPILFLTTMGGLLFAQLERGLANWLLNEEISAERLPLLTNPSLRDRILGTLSHGYTWRSMLYLFIKFPLGIASFVGMTLGGGLTLSLLFAPLLYMFSGGDMIVEFGPVIFDSFFKSLAAPVFGLVFLPIFIVILNKWAEINGKFASLMLSPTGAPRNRRVEREMAVIESGDNYIDPLAEIEELKEEEKAIKIR